MTDTGKHITQRNFETLYIHLREQEGRIYTDEELANLPKISDTHSHYAEWQMRKHSSQKLITYLKKKNKPLDILEIGCGNGWLSHRLSALPQSKVIGIDINFLELQQAARVFQNIANLHFMYVQAEAGVFKEKKFDTIVFAASIQYFASLSETINRMLRLLKPGGEIHIIDSHFYLSSDLSEARHRSVLYYESAGFPEMAAYYFHYSLEDLKDFEVEVLYNPGSWANSFTKNKNPFYWISIKNG